MKLFWTFTGANTDLLPLTLAIQGVTSSWECMKNLCCFSKKNKLKSAYYFFISLFYFYILNHSKHLFQGLQGVYVHKCLTIFCLQHFYCQSFLWLTKRSTCYYLWNFDDKSTINTNWRWENFVRYVADWKLVGL